MRETLVFKWTVSRAHDTHGYNICSLYVDGKKVSSCNGSGYDMRGTVLACWIEYKFQKELLKLDKEFYGLTFHDPNYDLGKKLIEGETVEEREKARKSIGLERYQACYGTSSKTPTDKHVIPLIYGACGFSSVEHIINAIGYELERVVNKENTYILMELDEKKV